MADHTNARGRTGLALILTLLMLFATACKSTADSGSSSSSSGGTTAVASSAPSHDATKVCGTPPCERFVSRGDTKTLANTLTDHPILSTVALHAAVVILCGGILCLLGEGVSMEYVNRAAKDATAQHACLMVSILPDSSKWKLVSLSASNQSPYCTD
ncbi:hypothetical protein [Catenulispora pinisilvae]|uniref:hypothetical protein n=1 Tax=Catenulispora pinisilvae TaxID=2705253 RepID=UPI0018918B63|nr:hypothetical protein [Catenulispora pinisilvae]